MSDRQQFTVPPPPTAMDNLAGDADVDPASGYIEVDHSAPSHPVVRFRADRLPEGGSALTPAEGSGLEIKEDGKLDLVGRAAAIEGGCGGNFAVHEIKYKDASGDTQIYHLLSCGDIDLTDFKSIRSIDKSKSGKTTTVTITLTDGTTKTFTVEDGDDGTDGADGEDGVSPSVTIADITDEGGNVVGHTISITDAEHDGSAEHPAQVFTIMNGADGEDGEDGAPGADASVTVSTAAVTGGTQVTITPYSGSTAGTPQSFTVLDGKDGKDGQDGAPGADGQDGQDATVTTTTTPSDCVLSTGSAAVGSSGEAARADHVHKLPSTVVDDSRTKDLKYGNTTLGKIVASQNATITPLSIAQGSNITFTRVGNTIVISAAGGGGTSGYSTPAGGADLSVAAMRYDPSSHQLQVKYHHDVYENGLLKTRTTDTEWTMMTGGQAVEETAGESSS